MSQMSALAQGQTESGWNGDSPESQRPACWPYKLVVFCRRFGPDSGSGSWKKATRTGRFGWSGGRGRPGGSLGSLPQIAWNAQGRAALPAFLFFGRKWGVFLCPAPQAPSPPLGMASSAQDVAPAGRGRQEGRWKGQMKKAVAGLWLTPSVTSSL